ncbi:MAG: 2-hydroxychromene-2-carboxylate isomerase [Methyloligellaceae bacterium]
MPETVSVFWSMRSPYCYLSLDRLLKIQDEFDVTIDIRTVYPIAVRNPDFFAKAPRHYRPYHLRDSARVAEYLGIPYRRPVPDPIVQDMETNEIAVEQPYISRLTRLAAAAQEQGRGLAFQDQVMRLLWDGRTDNWDQRSHLRDAIARAGLDADALMDAVEADPARFEAIIAANQEAQQEAGHAGVPLFVFDGEPFFGQDRIDLLVWRMQQKGVAAPG